MKFQTEIQLVDTLKKTLNETYGKACIEIFEEVSLGYGIADLVISNLIKPRRKLVPSQFALNSCDINIYNLISQTGEVSFDSIVETTRSSTREISRSLEKLLSNNYVKIVDSVFYIDQNYELPFNFNFAIEAKLKDWKRALKQAYRYKWFAEYSFVVMDAHYAKAAIRNISIFEKYNVGLATISPNGKLIRYYSPIQQRPIDPKMQILFSEKIRNNYEFAR